MMDTSGSDIEHVRVADLRLVVALASTRSFGRTAAHCGMPRSTVSRRIAELEQAVGVTLFDRTTRRVDMTDAGARFVEHAQQALDAVGHAVEATRGAAGLRGTLRVGGPPVLGGLLLRPAILALLAAHPGVSVELDTTGVFQDVQLERLDVVVRLGEDPQEHRGRVLGHCSFVLVAAPDRPPVAAPTALRASDLLGPEAPVTLTRGREEVRLVPRGRLRSADLGDVMAAAAAGLGVARLPYPMVRRALEAAELVRVLPRWDVGRSTLRCLHRAPRPLVRDLVDRIVASPVLPFLTAVPPVVD